MSGPRVNVTSTRAMVAAASLRGVDTSALLARHGVPEAVLEDPDARLDASVVHALWTDATEQSAEPSLPVFAALELPWGAYRVIDYLCGHSAGLAEATRLLSQNFGLVNDAVRLTLDEADGGAIMRIHRGDGGQIPPRYVDYALTACVHRMSKVIGGDVHPRVLLRRSPPADLTAHTLAFGPHVVFDQPLDEVHYDADLWSRPSVTPDPGLRSVLSSHAQLLLSQIDTPPSLLSRVRDEVEQGLPRGRTELAWIARRLDMSPRTLQRRLGEEGLTWRAFISSIRNELACNYLRDPTLSVEEVACMVGYAEATSFHRAFVRRVGQTPGAWRHTH